MISSLKTDSYCSKRKPVKKEKKRQFIQGLKLEVEEGHWITSASPTVQCPVEFIVIKSHLSFDLFSSSTLQGPSMTQTRSQGWWWCVFVLTHWNQAKQCPFRWVMRNNIEKVNLDRSQSELKAAPKWKRLPFLEKRHYSYVNAIIRKIVLSLMGLFK